MTSANLPLIGSGYRPSIYCSRCHNQFAVSLERCPQCRQPQWLSRIDFMVQRWGARAAYRFADLLGGA